MYHYTVAQLYRCPTTTSIYPVCLLMSDSVIIPYVVYGTSVMRIGFVVMSIRDLGEREKERKSHFYCDGNYAVHENHNTDSMCVRVSMRMWNRDSKHLICIFGCDVAFFSCHLRETIFFSYLCQFFCCAFPFIVWVVFFSLLILVVIACCHQLKSVYVRIMYHFNWSIRRKKWKFSQYFDDVFVLWEWWFFDRKKFMAYDFWDANRDAIRIYTLDFFLRNSESEWKKIFNLFEITHNIHICLAICQTNGHFGQIKEKIKKLLTTTK